MYPPELANSIENAIVIAFLSTIAIAIDKAIFQLLLLLLIRASSNYWHFNRNYCFTVLAWNAVFVVSKYTFWSQMHSRLNEDAFLRLIFLLRHLSTAETVLLLLTYYCYWPFFGTIAIGIAIAKETSRLLLLVLLLLRGLSELLLLLLIAIFTIGQLWCVAFFGVLPYSYCFKGGGGGGEKAVLLSLSIAEKAVSCLLLQIHSSRIPIIIIKSTTSFKSTCKKLTYVYFFFS